ncbi:Quercetin-3-sulfate 4'-sulfotransferase [Handroanthus impetiginosus]|uniref:Sulfotransferase n=1 Tax=Handroanthus impetiginosus TaxID=429701 RepID=A0A2G9H9R2_9LAMI|nr:Quercetin-3-sulfate 4'-sulfotransferase [Handroanthus impetiginosus]
MDLSSLSKEKWWGDDYLYELNGFWLLPPFTQSVILASFPKTLLFSIWRSITFVFCRGLIPCGPYHDHVMGYKKLNLERSKEVFFVTYEELMSDPKTHVKELAKFVGCPFEGDDAEEQVVEVVKSCSFEVLSNYEVNKSEESPSCWDYKNCLNNEIIEHADALTKEKFHSNGFMYGI